MVRIFLDSADLAEMRRLAPQVDGFTTNPTLMRKAGVSDYKAFALEALALGKPVSLEVFADDFTEMERQARLICSWGENAIVKIPITDSQGHSSLEVIDLLSASGLCLNITAVMTSEQIRELGRRQVEGRLIVSIFAGRIADTGRDPMQTVRFAGNRGFEVLWASAREVLNVRQAEDAGADIITLSPELLAKMTFTGKDLTEFSRETVQMFHDDAKVARYSL